MSIAIKFLKTMYINHIFRKPTIGELSAVSQKLGLNVSDKELSEYQALVASNLEEWDVLKDVAEPQLPVRYPRTPGWSPRPEENPYNAWAWKTDIKGAAEGKLKGMRVAVKDSIPVAGVPLRCGSYMFDGYMPDFDATVITRILDAGAVITGKSTCEDLCYSAGCITSISGPCLNPHDVTRSAAGSSSGSAVLLAAGDVELAFGADQGGSIRLPASWAGVVGHKPTYGLVPFTGCMSMEGTLDHVGPMARTVYDCALMLEVIAGYDNGLDKRQPVNLTVPSYTSQLTGDLSGIRVGLVQEGFANCEPDVAGLVTNRALALTTFGASVNQVDVPLHAKGSAIWSIAASTGIYNVMMASRGVSVGSGNYVPSSLVAVTHAGAETNLHQLSPTVKMMMLLGEYVKDQASTIPYTRGQNLVRVLRQAYDDALASVDVLIMPTIKYKAPKILHKDTGPTDVIKHCFGPIANTAPFNSTGHPAISVNAGFSEDKLPVGLMIVGRHFEDGLVLRVAQCIEKLAAQP